MKNSTRFKFRRKTLAWLCLTALFGAFQSNPTAAQSDQDRALRARRSGAADLGALRRQVESRIGGTVVGVSPVGAGRSLRYHFKVLRGADVVQVVVNAKSGAITSVREPNR
ncbi:MAG: hypothetical protein AAF607_15300 [Pseudomonadota bacterium]